MHEVYENTIKSRRRWSRVDEGRAEQARGGQGKAR